MTACLKTVKEMKKEIALLIRKFLTGKSSPEEDRLLDAWYREPSRDLMSLSDAEWQAIKGRIWCAIARRMRRPLARPYVRMVRSFAAAAAIAALLVASWWFVRPDGVGDRDPQSEQVALAPVTEATESGEVRQIRLPDGTAVWLNAQTALRYGGRFGEKSRELTLEGEAFFDVANDPAKPFVIHSPGGMQTTVLGTAFNLKAYPGLSEQVVSVQTGSVLVSGQNGEAVRITTNQKATLNLHRNALSAATTDGELAASWRSGNIVFDCADREEIALRIRQRFGKEVALENNALAGIHFIAAYPPHTSLEQIAKAIAATAGVRYSIQGEKVTFGELRIEN